MARYGSKKYYEEKCRDYRKQITELKNEILLIKKEEILKEEKKIIKSFSYDNGLLFIGDKVISVEPANIEEIVRYNGYVKVSYMDVNRNKSWRTSENTQDFNFEESVDLAFKTIRNLVDAARIVAREHEYRGVGLAK